MFTADSLPFFSINDDEKVFGTVGGIGVGGVGGLGGLGSV